jgi:hypothetical protein
VTALKLSTTTDFVELCSSEWFERCWTLQELVVSSAPVLMIGYQVVPWSAFENFQKIKPFTIKGPSLDATFYRKNNRCVSRWLCRMFYHAYVVEFGLTAMVNSGGGDDADSRLQRADALSQFFTHVRGLQATDPRDRIYSVRQLMLDIGADLPEVNYSKSVEEVFEEVTRTLIIQTRRLWPLGFTRYRSRDLNLPSWVPDWGYTIEEDPFVDNYETLTGTTKTSFTEVDPHATSAWHSGMLRLNGSQLATIKSSSVQFPLFIPIERLTEETPYHDAMQQEMEYGLPLVEWFSFSTREGLPGSGALDELAEIVYRSSPGAWPKHRPKFDLVSRLVSHLNREVGGWREWSLAFKGPANDLLGEMHRRCSEGVLFATATDHLGICWSLVEDGDVVAHLAGCACPVILRPSGGHYRFISLSYIPALMEEEHFGSGAQIEDLDTFVLI